MEYRTMGILLTYLFLAPLFLYVVWLWLRQRPLAWQLTLALWLGMTAAVFLFDAVVLWKPDHECSQLASACLASGSRKAANTPNRPKFQRSFSASISRRVNTAESTKTTDTASRAGRVWRLRHASVLDLSCVHTASDNPHFLRIVRA